MVCVVAQTLRFALIVCSYAGYKVSQVGWIANHVRCGVDVSFFVDVHGMHGRKISVAFYGEFEGQI